MQLLGGLLVLSPTDLVAYSGCEHRTRLDMLVARGELARPFVEDAFTEVLRKHGNRHEARHLQRLRSGLRQVVEIARPASTIEGLRAAEAETLAAMRAGVEVIYQASFFDGRWRGHADFLRRVETPTALGPWGYEAHDTKLARRTKASTLLQLGEYSRHVARLQGVPPRALHVVLGDDRVDSYLFCEVSAYVDSVRARLEAAVEGGLGETSPDPVAMCAFCDWRDRCRGEWRAADHLSLVAGIRRDQRTRLVEAGIGTRTELADVTDAVVVPRLRPEQLQGLSTQAALQVRSEAEGRLVWSLVEPDPLAPERGLAALPEPSPGDVFFDMEGDRFVGVDGREYLFGWVLDDGAGPRFDWLWAHDPAAEKAAFERFVDTVMARRRAFPGMHVYHYASYETDALKRLMGRHATREEEIDTLLRGGVFVDLYRVVRQGVRIGVESYSIKKLEPLYMERPRAAAIVDAGTSVVQYETWLDEQDPGILEAIRRYNEEDCFSVVGLRGWLEARRTELEEVIGDQIPRPTHAEGQASETVAAATEAVERLAAELMDGVPADPGERTREHAARALLASLLDWHRRDAKPGWWEYYSRWNASDDELIEDTGAVGGLTFVGEAEQAGKSRVFCFSFPPQETKLGEGESVEDPRTFTDEAGRQRTRKAGTIHAIDPVRGELSLRRTGDFEALPTSVIAAGSFDHRVLREALLRVGSWVRDHGIDGPGDYRAVRDLLLRAPPRVSHRASGSPLRRDGEGVVEAARRVIRDAEATCVPVQGPPGSGKTRTAAIAILDLVTAVPSRPVAVTALSHRAITHLLDGVCKEARERGVAIRVMQRSDDARGCADPMVQCVGSTQEVVAAVEEGAVDVVAGTVWVLARPELHGRFDTLIVDEAAQISLANVVAAGGCARSIALFGDPQQLEQPSSGVHPPGAAASALGHLLDGAETIAGDRGLFLDITWRLHPDVCDYISSTFYESRLRPAPLNARQRVGGEDELAGTGLRWLPIVHAGNRSVSEEEAGAVEALVARLLGRPWLDCDGEDKPLSGSDILVVAPYNAQVAALRRRLPDGVEAGTVDRFQGREAAVVVYSMATSVAEEVPRGLDFLFSRHRTNVAVSRARCLSILVCSPQLLEVFCTHAATVPLINALCAYVEHASIYRGPIRFEGTRPASTP